MNKINHSTQDQSVRGEWLLTEGVFYKGCRPLPRLWRAGSGCGSGVFGQQQQLTRHRRAELHGERRRCTPPSPERCRHMWSRWGPGAAGWSGPDAWPGGHFRRRDNHRMSLQLLLLTLIRRQLLSTASGKNGFNQYFWTKSLDCIEENMKPN